MTMPLTLIVAFGSTITASRAQKNTFKFVVPIGIGGGEGKGEQANASSCLAHGVFAVLCYVFQSLCLTELRIKVLNKKKVA